MPGVSSSSKIGFSGLTERQDIVGMSSVPGAMVEVIAETLRRQPDAIIAPSQNE